MHSAVLRRKGAWRGWLPRTDDTGFWPQTHWLWWSWDYLPARAASSVCDQVDGLRRGLS